MTQLQKIPYGQVVTATNFVRNFATYARNAKFEPIHIVNHGRPAWSLVATEDLARLADSQFDDGGERRIRAKLDIVLDMVPTLIILIDENLHVLRANPAARRFFQFSDEEIRGASLSRILNNPKQDFLLRAVERVCNSGAAETFEMDSVDASIRTFQVKIVPFPGGTALFADEITHALAIRQADALAVAFANVIDASPELARGIINMRGVIVSASAAFVKLVGTDETRILGVRFAGIFDASSRADISDAVENLLSEGVPFTQAANLLTQNAPSAPVIVSATSYRGHDKGEGALFLLRRAA